MGFDGIVSRTTRQLALPGAEAVPQSLKVVVQVVYGVHRFWHGWGRGQLYRNPRNFPALACGLLFDLSSVGDNRYLRLAAQTLLISQSILDHLKSQEELQHSYLKWRDALSLQSIVPCDHSRKIEPLYSWISPSTSHTLYVYLYTMEHHLRQIAWRTFKLCRSIFNTNMTMIDAAEALAMDPSMQGEANRESCVNFMRCLDMLVQNREELLNKMTANKEVINTLLKMIRAPCRAEEFIDYVDRVMKVGDQGGRLINRFNINSSQQIGNTLKYLFFGAMSLLGKSEWVPDRFVPSRGCLDDCVDTKKYGRYVDVYCGVHPAEAAPAAPALKVQSFPPPLSIEAAIEAALKGQRAGEIETVDHL